MEDIQYKKFMFFASKIGFDKSITLWYNVCMESHNWCDRQKSNTYNKALFNQGFCITAPHNQDHEVGLICWNDGTYRYG